MTSRPSRRRVLATTAGLAAAPAGSTRGAAPGGAVEAAVGVLRRRLGDDAPRVRLVLGEPAEDAWYRFRSDGGSLLVEGSSGVALARGAYTGLRAAGAWCMERGGDRIAIPARLPTLDSGRVASRFRRRAYLNPCTFGYTTPWWNWPEWEREIDGMALMGVDLPLALEGQEIVWQALWREQGLTTAELAAHFSGPAFCPWQRMGNIEGWLAPLPAGWIARKSALQRRILGRMRELGMEPVLPAFAGYVPSAWATRHPQAAVHLTPSWEGFDGVAWLDPLDPRFGALAGRFLDLYTQTYGEGRFHLADAFNEVTPPLRDGAGGPAFGDAHSGRDRPAAAPVDAPARDARLRAYGAAICDSVRRARPGAVQVMQGWLFGADPAFWTPAAIAAFLDGAPDDGLLVLDIGNDRRPEVWARAHAYGGKRWVYGYVSDYGGSNPVYGDLGFQRDDLAAIAARTDTGRLEGFGAFPEGLHAPALVLEHQFDMAWGPRPAPSVAAWLSTYLRARYGRTGPELEAAWADLVQGAFRTRYWSPRWWRDAAGAYLLFKRPRLDMAEFEGEPGDLRALDRGVRRLAALAPQFEAEPLFVGDLARLTRHLAGVRIDGRLPPAIRAYRAGEVATGDRLLAEVTALTLAVDRLAGVENAGLAGWLDSARAYADVPGDAAAYALNARMQVTVWGGSGHLNDYASKAWQGLYRDFYLPRWTMFLQALRTQATGGVAFDPDGWTRRVTAWEQDWVRQDRPCRHVRPDRPARAAADLLQQLEAA